MNLAGESASPDAEDGGEEGDIVVVTAVLLPPLALEAGESGRIGEGGPPLLWPAFWLGESAALAAAPSGVRGASWSAEVDAATDFTLVLTLKLGDTDAAVVVADAAPITASTNDVHLQVIHCNTLRSD